MSIPGLHCVVPAIVQARSCVAEAQKGHGAKPTVPGVSSAIRAECGQNPQSMVRDADRHLARNPRQRWTARLGGYGLVVTPESRGWTWTLTLHTFGAAGEEYTVKHPIVTTAENHRLSDTWEGRVEEWFHNLPARLEHGFLLHKCLSAEDERSHFILNTEGAGVHASEFTSTAHHAVMPSSATTQCGALEAHQTRTFAGTFLWTGTETSRPDRLPCGTTCFPTFTLGETTT
jgi:hypothetical protein